MKRYKIRNLNSPQETKARTGADLVHRPPIFLLWLLGQGAGRRACGLSLPAVQLPILCQPE